MQRGIRIFCVWMLLLLALTAGYARAHERAALLLPPTNIPPPPPDRFGDFFVQKTQGELPGQEKKEAPPTPAAPDPFAAAPQTSSTAPSGVNPHMIGDFPGSSALKVVTVPMLREFQFTVLERNPETGTIEPVVVTIQAPGTTTNVVRVPSAAQGSFKIAENQSPLPQDRCYFSLNHFNNVQGLGGGADLPRFETVPLSLSAPPPPPPMVSGRVGTQQIGGAFPPGTVVPATSFNPGFPPVTLDVQRQVFGFEKTLLDGRASIGARVPFFQQHGNEALTEDGMGDLSVILKYAFYLDRQTSNVFSGGLVVTAPTGAGLQTVVGDIHPTLLQPFVGFLWNEGDFFVQGFSSLVFPTDSRDVTLAFNDVSIGYWLYRGGPDRLLRSIVPTAEIHVTTPLTNRSESNPIFVPDMVICTGGVHLGLTEKSVLTLGVATPVSGPSPFDTEVIVQFNYRY